MSVGKKLNNLETSAHIEKPNTSQYMTKYRSNHYMCALKKGVLLNSCKLHRKTPVPGSSAPASDI